LDKNKSLWPKTLRIIGSNFPQNVDNLPCSQQFLQQPQQQSQHHTDEQHSRNGQVKAEIFALYTNIPRQSAQPRQLVAEEVHDQADQHDEQPAVDNQFAGVGHDGYWLK